MAILKVMGDGHDDGARSVGDPSEAHIAAMSKRTTKKNIAKHRVRCSGDRNSASLPWRQISLEKLYVYATLHLPSNNGRHSPKFENAKWTSA